MAKNVEVHVNLPEGMVATAGAGAILTSFVKFLAVRREQIPFAFQTFQHLMNSVRRDDLEAPSWKEFQLERQRELAHGTLKNYQDLFHAIRLAFGLNVQEAVLLFGATVHSAKEAWRIEFPSNLKTNSPEISSGKLQRMADHTVMTINAQQDLSANLSRPFQPTNMYLMVKVAGKLPRYPHIVEAFTERDECFIPGSCNVSRIVLESSDMEEPMEVCEDRYYSCWKKSKKWMPCSDLFKENKRKEEEPQDHPGQWYECLVNVKGYKDVQVRGKAIWNM